MNTSSIEERLVEEFKKEFFHSTVRKDNRDYIEFSTIAVPYDTVENWLRSALSQARQEGREEAIKEIRDGFYKRGETGGKHIIVWDATDVVKVMDEILSALTTEGK